MGRRTLRHNRRGPRFKMADPKVGDRFMTAVRAGVPLKHAAAAAGVSERSMYELLRRANEVYALVEDAAEAGEPRPSLTEEQEWMLEFRAETEQARATVAAANVALIGKAARGGYVKSETTRTYTDDDGKRVTETSRVFADVEWRAAAWMLERSFPGDFSRDPDRVRLEVSSAGDGVSVGGAVRGTDALAARLAAMAARRVEDDASGWGDGPAALGPGDGGGEEGAVDAEVVEDEHGPIV